MYILAGDDRAVIARRPVKIEVSGKDGAGTTLPEGAVLMAARRGEGPAPGALSPRPSQMILPRIDDGPAVVVRVLPGRGVGLFAEGTTVNLTIRTDRGRDGEGDVVVVRDVPVSGLAVCDLVALEIHDATRLQVFALAIPRNTPLGPLAAAARDATRHRLGDDDTMRARSLLVAVDMSVSMSAAFRDGTVAATVDVVAGMSDVIGVGQELRVCLLAEHPVLLPPAEPADLAAATLDAAGTTGMGCGFRSVPAGLPTVAGGLTFVVTDGVPADAAMLRTARRRGEDIRLVVADRRRPSPRAADLPVTLLGPPPGGVDAAAHLLRTPGLLSGTVGSMLDRIPEAVR
jgi:hypothetical protein